MYAHEELNSSEEGALVRGICGSDRRENEREDRKRERERYDESKAADSEGRRRAGRTSEFRRKEINMHRLREVFVGKVLRQSEQGGTDVKLEYLTEICGWSSKEREEGKERKAAELS